MMANKKTTKSTKTTKKVVKKENVVVAHTEWQNVGMLAQLILSLSVLFFGGLCIFNNDFLIAVEKLLGLTIITMAYNNHFTYKRTLDNEYIIDCNLSNTNQKAASYNGYTCIYPNEVKDITILNPYEARIYKKEK